jgi:hypothetical protein
MRSCFKDGGCQNLHEKKHPRIGIVGKNAVFGAVNGADALAAIRLALGVMYMRWCGGI